MQFLKSNWVYFLWFIVYFLIGWLFFGGNTNAFVIVAVSYGISIGIALSPLGEWILRAFEGARPLQTSEEREYLEPIFEEVYENAKRENPSLNNDITLYILDEMYVNAFAIGRKTIAVTNGAIETFTEEELKGVIAHEFGHITYGHTKALLLSVVGNLLFSIIIFVLRICMTVVEFISTMFSGSNVVTFVIAIMSFLTKIFFELSMFVFMYLGQVLLSLNSRSNEFQADSFAHRVSYGEELISALYLLKKMSGSQKLTLKQKMTASHPHIAERIARLENMYQSLESSE